MIKIELENGTIISIDGKEVISANEFKEKFKTPADIKVEMLLNYLEAIDKCTYSQATVDHIFGVIRKFCEVVKKDVSDIN